MDKTKFTWWNNSINFEVWFFSFFPSLFTIINIFQQNFWLLRKKNSPPHKSLEWNHTSYHQSEVLDLYLQPYSPDLPFIYNVLFFLYSAAMDAGDTTHFARNHFHFCKQQSKKLEFLNEIAALRIFSFLSNMSQTALFPLFPFKKPWAIFSGTLNDGNTTTTIRYHHGKRYHHLWRLITKY